MSISRTTISGYAGTGKSTVGKIVAEKSGRTFLSVGNFSREFADKEFGMNINEFQALCKERPELDDLVNHRFRDECNRRNGIVADFRLGFHFVQDAFHVLITASEEEAFRRLSNSDRGKELTDFESVRKRNIDMRTRFIEHFGVDFADENNYDLVIGTDGKNPHDVAEEILAAIGAYTKNLTGGTI